MDNDRLGERPRIDAYLLEFTGTGREFFRVWIVNVLLTVVTFGFYTPFARRRTAQYFYSHTLVASSPLEFTAGKKKMVVGFLILVVLYGAFQLAAETGQDSMVTFMMVAGAVLAPYFWASAMRFRLGSTRWRGVRLQFTAGWLQVYLASWPLFVIALAWIGVSAFAGTLVAPGATKPQVYAVLGPILGVGAVALVVSILCAIRLEFNYKSLLVARARIGGQSGRWKPVFGDFVQIWVATLGVFLLSVLLVGVAIAVALGGSIALFRQLQGTGLMVILVTIALVILGFFVLFLISGPARAYREARMFHLVWNNIGVSHVARFRCDLSVASYVWLRIRNILFTLLTLGLYRPFAMLSEYAMKTDSVSLHVKGSLGQLVGQLAREENGLGDALADAAGLDLVG
ncbi:YjgN family protein [Ramlibacter sp. PS3R-8]|uniref:YjgN family protein n=1 Tax=Ramlibacter sp. PS3R-8 TaxID=3133437 RepID=UPI0030B424FE